MQVLPARWLKLNSIQLWAIVIRADDADMTQLVFDTTGKTLIKKLLSQITSTDLTQTKVCAFHLQLFIKPVHFSYFLLPFLHSEANLPIFFPPYETDQPISLWRKDCRINPLLGGYAHILEHKPVRFKENWTTHYIFLPDICMVQVLLI